MKKIITSKFDNFLQIHSNTFPAQVVPFSEFGVINVSMEDILKTFNTTDTWLDAETVANLKGISARAVRLSIKKYDYKEETVRGIFLYI